MHTIKTSGGYVVRLDLGQEVMASLLAFAQQQELAGGAITGIGAVKDTTLGFFDLHRKSYDQRSFPDDMELVSLVGNITWLEGERMIHAHAVLSGPDLAAVGGHLFGATIAVTGEFFVVPSDQRVHRAADPHTGLNLMAGPDNEPPEGA